VESKRERAIWASRHGAATTALAPRARRLSIEEPHGGVLTGPGSQESAFELPIDVHPDDIDRLGHVNNVVYLRWIQDAAIAHWRVLATPAQQSEVAWVVVRHEIDYKRPVRLGDGVVARTWVGLASRNTFERHTEILRTSDRKMVAQARTLWCPVDPATGRPAQVSADIRDRFSTGEA